MNKSVFSGLLIFLHLFIFGQEEGPLPCATDLMHQQLLDEYPNLQAPIYEASQRLEEFTETFLPNQQRNGDPYIIPVVFHVIHNFGPENISDEQIYDAIEQVNIQMRKKNADTVAIVSQFRDIAADTEIEIRLAQLDPDGNCTSGITRHVSGLTMIGDHSVKDIVQWPPDKYLNIYVCNQAASLAGHAMLPGAADTVPEWDGIVMQHSYVGTIGTSNDFRRTVVTHEIGHYLNLQHIWGGNNVPNYFYLPVAQPENCDHDDGVEDTPLTIGWQSCDLNGTSCGSLDNVQNYMDYAYCALMFTEGQKERMHACLNSPIANRNNLWTEENLIATGVKDYTPTLCEARVSASKQVVCVGESISFSDISFHGVNSRTWTFEGATISSSTDSVVVVTFNEVGLFSVSLEVSDGTDTKSVSLNDFIKVIPEKGTQAGLSEDFESVSVFNSRWVVEHPSRPLNWEIADVGFQSNRSLKLANNNSERGANYTFYNLPVDASDLTSFELQFDVAFARNAPTNSDFLRIEVSTDCGDSWTIRRNISSSDLSAVGVLDNTEDWAPTSDEDWKRFNVTNISSNFLTENLMVRFYFNSNNGNNFYIDNIMMGPPGSLSTVNEMVNNELVLYPNPNTGSFTLKGLEPGSNYQLKVLDVLGKLVHEGSFKAQGSAEIMHLNGLPQGVYMFEIANEKLTHRTKVIIRH